MLPQDGRAAPQLPLVQLPPQHRLPTPAHSPPAAPGKTMWRRSFLSPQPLPLVRVPASLRPSRLHGRRAKQQPSRSRGRQCQVPQAPARAGSAHAGRLGELQRGGPATLRPLHLLPRGHPAGSTRTPPQQLARTGPGLQLGHNQPSGARTVRPHSHTVARVGRDLKDHESPTPSPQAGPPTSTCNTRPGCPRPHPTGPSTPPGTGHPPHRSPCQELPPDIQPKPLLPQLQAISPCPAVIYPFKELQ